MSADVVRLVDVRVEEAAPRILYDLLRERSIEDDPHVNISHRQLPTWEEHARFFAHPPYYAWYLVRINLATYAGYVSITYRNEVGIVFFREHRGRGYGRSALELLLDRHKPLSAIHSRRPGRFVANINPGNERSIELFKSLGFHLIQETYAFDPPKEEV